MDYKEKYKKALERAKKLYEQGTITESLGYVFPELQENEDERIRKAIIAYISHDQHCGVPNADMIAWLEKQKVTDEEIIFRPIVGTDIRIAAKQALEKINIGKKVVLAFNGAYISVNGKTVGEIDSEYDAWLKKQGDNKPTENVETKFYEGDKIVSNQNGKVYTVGTAYWVAGDGEDICLHDTDGNHLWTNRDDLDKNYHLCDAKKLDAGDLCRAMGQRRLWRQGCGAAEARD